MSRSDLRSLLIRCVHVDGPQPGQVAIVTGIVEKLCGHQWLDCYVARFDDGEMWFCPVMAVKDYECVRCESVRSFPFIQFSELF